MNPLFIIDARSSTRAGKIYFQFEAKTRVWLRPCCFVSKI